MRIYCAGKLNGSDATEYLRNVHKMISVALELKRKGHSPYVPALDLLIGIVAGDWDYKDYANLNMDFVDVCEALFYISPSFGADKELARAKELGKIIYTEMGQVPDDEPLLSR